MHSSGRFNSSLKKGLAEAFSRVPSPNLCYTPRAAHAALAVFTYEVFVMKLLRRIKKSAGGVVRSVDRATKGAARAVSKTPAVGPALAAVVRLQTGPIDLAARLVSGQRVDRAALGHLRQKVRDVKEVMPYVQTIIATVPAVGPGVSAALGAGVAIASGSSITEITIAAVRGAIPGGPLAAAAYDVATKVVSNASIDAIQKAGANLSPKQRQALGVLVGNAKAAVDGKPFSEAAALEAAKQLPPEVARAASVGLAMGIAQRKQIGISKSVTPKALNELSKGGARIIAASPTLKAGAEMVGQAALPGFKVGASLSLTKPAQALVEQTRVKLTEAQKKGFDLAMAAGRGMGTAPAPRGRVASSKEAFGYAAAHGAQTLPAQQKTKVVAAISANPQTRGGVQAAIETPVPQSLWARIVEKMKSLL